MPKISVILPCYNAESTISEAIQSILTQTFSDFELIVIDDGSRDHSANIVESFNDTRILFIKNEKNLGLIRTLNKGIDLASGEYIARMDADDIALPERFAKQVCFLDTHPEVALLGTGYECFPKTKTIIPIEKPTLLDMLKACPFGHPTVMFRRKKFLEAGLRYDLNYPHAEDYELWSRAIRVFTCCNLQEPLLKYRVHLNSITSTQSAKMSETADRVRQNLLDFLTSNPKEQKLIKAISEKKAVSVKISFLKLAFYFFMSKLSSGRSSKKYRNKYNRLKYYL